jgi:protein SCO1/2
VLGVVALTATGCGATHHAAPAAASSGPSGPQLHGLVPTPLPSLPRFTLTDTAGHPFSFAARARGKLTYLYFGYTHCPDVCPLTMGNLAAALRHATPALRRKVQVVFVTVDPHRDTPRTLRAWLNNYNRSFIGLTGSEQAIRRAALDSGIPLPPPSKQSSDGVVHSSFVFPYSPDGHAHVVYTQGFSALDYAHDMPLLASF